MNWILFLMASLLLASNANAFGLSLQNIVLMDGTLIGADEISTLEMDFQGELQQIELIDRTLVGAEDVKSMQFANGLLLKPTSLLLRAMRDSGDGSGGG